MPSFQFHKGTIKTPQQSEGSFLHNYFNSIKVRLKHCAAISDEDVLQNFNSIKVRLKQKKMEDEIAKLSEISIP